MIDTHDASMIYCSLLGGEIPFKYCRSMKDGLPCGRIIVCWEFRMDISAFLNHYYSREQIERSLAPSQKTRLETILELIGKARREGEGD